MRKVKKQSQFVQKTVGDWHFSVNVHGLCVASEMRALLHKDQPMIGSDIGSGRFLAISDRQNLTVLTDTCTDVWFDEKLCTNLF